MNILELADAADPVEQSTANQREAGQSRIFVYRSPDIGNSN